MWEKFHLTHNFTIMGVALSLLAISAWADQPLRAATPSENPSMQLAQTSSSPQNLGTLPRTDVDTATPAAQTGQPTDDALRPIDLGNIVYITGGIGDEERAALQSVKNSYNLHVLSASKDGAYTGDTRINIHTQDGKALVDTPVGPLFYAKLPRGTYIIKASSEDQVKEQRVTIGLNKSSSINFIWQ